MVAVGFSLFGKRPHTATQKQATKGFVLAFYLSPFGVGQKRERERWSAYLPGVLLLPVAVVIDAYDDVSRRRLPARPSWRLRRNLLFGMLLLLSYASTAVFLGGFYYWD